MMRYPTHKVYATIYAKYLHRNPKELLNINGSIKDKAILDICGGGGRASVAAQDLGATRVVMIEQEHDMIDPSLVDRGITVIDTSVEEALKALVDEKFHMIVCQQAVNYWLTEDTAKDVAKLLYPHKNSCFVFNTFNNKPSLFPITRQYEHQGLHYVEVSWLVGDLVHHVQICNGYPAHTTAFKWITQAQFNDILSPHFTTVNEIVQGKTSLWVCHM